MCFKRNLIFPFSSLERQYSPRVEKIVLEGGIFKALVHAAITFDARAFANKHLSLAAQSVGLDVLASEGPLVIKAEDALANAILMAIRHFCRPTDQECSPIPQ